MLDKSHPLILVNRYDHENCRCDANERVGTKSGRSTVKGTLKTDQRANYERTCHSAYDNEIIVTH
jgi:hypothetical protein